MRNGDLACAVSRRRGVAVGVRRTHPGSRLPRREPSRRSPLWLGGRQAAAGRRAAGSRAGARAAGRRAGLAARRRPWRRGGGSGQECRQADGGEGDAVARRHAAASHGHRRRPGAVWSGTARTSSARTAVMDAGRSSGRLATIARNRRVHRGRAVGPGFTEIRDRLFPVGEQDLHRRAAVVGRPAGEQEIEAAAEAVDVGALVGPARVGRLFRGHERGRAHHHAGGGQAGLGGLLVRTAAAGPVPCPAP